MIRAMSSNRIAYDLNTREGVVAYLQCAVVPDVQRAFALRGRVSPFGIVFARVVQGRPAKLPHPLMVGQPGMNAMAIKLAIQKLAARVGAVGCAYVRQDRFEDRAGSESQMVVLQVEHQQFPDLVWCGPVLRGALGPFAGPLDLGVAPVGLRKTAFLPQRCMS